MLLWTSFSSCWAFFFFTHVIFLSSYSHHFWHFFLQDLLLSSNNKKSDEGLLLDGQGGGGLSITKVKVRTTSQYDLGLFTLESRILVIPINLSGCLCPVVVPADQIVDDDMPCNPFMM